jgi:hypothetical protein
MMKAWIEEGGFELCGLVNRLTGIVFLIGWNLTGVVG